MCSSVTGLLTCGPLRRAGREHFKLRELVVCSSRLSCVVSVLEPLTFWSKATLVVLGKRSEQKAGTQLTFNDYRALHVLTAPLSPPEEQRVLTESLPICTDESNHFVHR